MKIFLLDLAHTQTVTDSSLTVPLGIGYIKAYLKQKMGDAVEVKLFKHPEQVLAQVAKEKPDIIGFANYGWNRDLNLKVGTYIRKILPQALMVAGGPNIDAGDSLCRKFFVQFDFLDFVVTLGGEEPFAELVTWWQENQGDETKLPDNLIWMSDGKICKTPERPLKKIIENIPSPYLEGHLDEFLAKGMIPLLETNRGCPFSCSFCAWGMASHDLVRRFDHKRALKEIEYVGERASALNWIVCDANFGLLKRDVELAIALRKVKDEKGLPKKCHVWTAKNVTERNLEIGAILNDMAEPVMAVQTMSDEVLRHIKRSNISTDTYTQYQKQFNDMGRRTGSDMIVPLPTETLKSHMDGIYSLMKLGVDSILNHNMRLLAGAETNSIESREKYNFKTRFRLIHGDAGVYKTPTGEEIRSFEYEESLRSTSTMSEEEVFYLRKLHFLVDCCWNLEFYRPLLTVLLSKGLNPIVILRKLISFDDFPDVPQELKENIKRFWLDFDTLSKEEWFDSEQDIEAYFAKEENFSRLIGLEFEKLNTLFSMKLLQKYKKDFDLAIELVAKSELPSEQVLINDLMGFVASIFPPLSYEGEETLITLPETLSGSPEGADDNSNQNNETQVRLYESDKRKEVKDIILNSEGQTLSKILNTQNVSISHLKYTLDESFGFGRKFKKYIQDPNSI